MGRFDGLLKRFGYVGANAVQEAVEAGVVNALKAAGEDEVTPAFALEQAKVLRYSTSDLAATAGQQAALYTQLDWISTAIDHVSNHAAGVIYNVRRRQGEDAVDIPNHDFEMLLEDPNPMQSRFELMRDTYNWYKLTGNSLTYLNRGGPKEPPAELWPIPAHMIRPVPDGQMYLKGYIFDPGSGEGIPLEPWEVCHVKTFNPLNPFWGLSAVQQLAIVARGDLAQQSWNTNLFDKENAKIPGALAFKSMIQNSDWTRLKAEANENWGGVKRKGPLMLRGVGTGGVEWLKMAMTQQEMEFLKSRQFTKEEIYGQLAPGLASVLAVNATEANAIAGKAILLEFGVWPMLQAVGAKFSKSIVKAYGDNLTGEFDDVRQANQLLDLKEQEEYSKSHMIDEIRKKYYGDKEIGDERGKLLPAEVTAKGLAAQVVADSNTPETGADIQPDLAPVDMQPADTTVELKAWERFAVKRLGRKAGREFAPRVLPLFQVARIRTALKGAATPEAVRSVFDQETNQGDTLADAVAELRRFNDLASAH